MTEDKWLTCEDSQALLSLMFLLDTNKYQCYDDRKLRLFACACCRELYHDIIDAKSTHNIDVAERFADGKATNKELAAARNDTSSLHVSNGSDSLAICYSWSTTEVNASISARYVASSRDLTKRAHILRDIIGNPFKPINIPTEWFCTIHGTKLDGVRCDDCKGMPPAGKAAKRCHWFTPDVISLAQAAYEERETTLAQCLNCSKPGRYCGECHGSTKRSVCTGRLDQFRLNMLADALEEAGVPPGEEVEQDCADCKGSGMIAAPPGDIARRWPCDSCDMQGFVKVYDANPILSHLRSRGPHYRGCWAIDLILGKGVT